MSSLIIFFLRRYLIGAKEWHLNRDFFWFELVKLHHQFLLSVSNLNPPTHQKEKFTNLPPKESQITHQRRCFPSANRHYRVLWPLAVCLEPTFPPCDHSVTDLRDLTLNLLHGRKICFYFYSQEQQQWDRLQRSSTSLPVLGE